MLDGNDREDTPVLPMSKKATLASDATPDYCNRQHTRARHIRSGLVLLLLLLLLLFCCCCRRGRGRGRHHDLVVVVVILVVFIPDFTDLYDVPTCIPFVTSNNFARTRAMMPTAPFLLTFCICCRHELR